MHMDGIHVDARKAEEEKTAALEIYRKELSRLVTLVEAGDEEQTPQLNAVGELLRYAKLTQQQSITFLEPYFNFHLRRAQTNNNRSQNIVAALYTEGAGVERNLAFAAEWYFKAGDIQKAYGVYKIAKKVGDREAMRGLYPQYLAQANNKRVDAQCLVGKMLQRGHGEGVNMDEAEKWFSKVRESDLLLGLRRLGRLYEERGESERAFALFKDAESSKDIEKYVKTDNDYNDEGDSIEYDREDVQSTFLSHQRAYRDIAVTQLTVPVQSSDEAQKTEPSKVERALTSLFEISPEAFESGNVGFLMSGMIVVKPIPGFLEAFDILGKFYVSVGKQNCALSRQIQTALTQGLYAAELEPLIEIDESSLKSLRKRERTQRALAEVGDEKAKLKLRYTTLALSRVEKDVRRLKAYAPAVDSLEKMVSKKAYTRREAFLTDDEYGFVR